MTTAYHHIITPPLAAEFHTSATTNMAAFSAAFAASFFTKLHYPSPTTNHGRSLRRFAASFTTVNYLHNDSSVTIQHRIDLNECNGYNSQKRTKRKIRHIQTQECLCKKKWRSMKKNLHEKNNHVDYQYQQRADQQKTEPTVWNNNRWTQQRRST